MADIHFKEVVDRTDRGELLVGVEPALARRFFTDSDSKALQREFGNSYCKERLLVKAVWLLEYLTLFAGLIASIFAFHWYSIIIIPTMVIITFLYGAKASAGHQNIGGVLSMLFVCITLAYYFQYRGIVLTVWLLLLPMPYLFARLTYKLSTSFLRSLSLNNERLFNFLCGKAIFLKPYE